MPRKNIYIRKEDIEAWDNIEDKPKWIHEGLTTGFVRIPPKSIIKTPVEAKKVVENIIKPIPKAEQSESVTYKPTQNWGA